MANNDIGFDPILGKLREIDVGGGTGGGESYDFNTNEFNVTGDNYVSLKSVPASKVAGAVTGIEASVSGGTATIAATGSTTSVKFTGTGGVDVKGNTTTGAVELDAKDLSDGTQSVTKELQNARHVKGLSSTPLTILHLSDVHDDRNALARIVADKTALGTLVDDAICTGDMVASYAEQIANWWNSSVMTCMGNHDTASYNGSTFDWTALSMADRDAYYIAPFESNWGITHTTGTSYYYKDYAEQNVRLIVMDGMLYTGSSTTTEAAAQTAWLEGLLASAISSGLHVLIAIHAPHGGATAVKCSFTEYGAATMPTYTDCNTPDEVVNAVASAISSGLHFIGYLCGHTHHDAVWDATGDGTQFMIAITCANYVNPNQWKNADLARSEVLDAFNLVSIDTEHSLVKIVRGGGANIDNKERERVGITIDYENHVVIDREVLNYANEAGHASSATLADSATLALGIASSAAGYGLAVDGGTMSKARYFPIEEASGATVTLMAGHAFRVEATSSAVTLNTETIPANSWGLDGHLDVFTTSADYIVAGPNVKLNDSFALNAWNSCTVRFASGVATVYVDNRSSIYLVTQNTDLTNGSLYFGLTDASVSAMNYIKIDDSLNGATLDLGGATVTATKHIVGNGVASNTLTGSVGAGAAGSVDMTDVSLSAVVLTGGNVGFGEVGIADGGTVTLASGTLALGSAVTGSSGSFIVSSGAIIDMTGNATSVPLAPGGGMTIASGGATFYPYAGSASAYTLDNFSMTAPCVGNENTIVLNGGEAYGASNCRASNVTFSGGTRVIASGFNMDNVIISGMTVGPLLNRLVYLKGGTMTNSYIVNNQGGKIYTLLVHESYLSNCVISGNTTSASSVDDKRDILDIANGTVLENCIIENNIAHGAYEVVRVSSGTCVVSNCILGAGQNVLPFNSTCELHMAGSNVFRGKFPSFMGGRVILTSGSILDLTSNTNSPVYSRTNTFSSAAFIVEESCTIINSGGTSLSVAGGTYSVLNKDGSVVSAV